MPCTIWPWLQAFKILWCFIMCFLWFFDKGTADTLLMFLMCFYVFFNFVNRRTTFAFLNFWRFLVYSVSCQKTIFAAGRHPEQTIWAIKAPTRRTKRFYKELDTSFELLPKVDEPELESVNPLSFLWYFDFRLTWVLKTRDHDSKAKPPLQRKTKKREWGFSNPESVIFEIHLLHTDLRFVVTEINWH